MKKKDVVGVDKELESYIELAGTIKSDIVAVLFNSLASASDEQYLTQWTSLAEKYKVDIPENAYACGEMKRRFINRYYSVLHRDWGLQEGMELRFTYVGEAN